MKELYLLLFSVLFILSGCEKKDIATLDCDQKAILNEMQYLKAPSDFVSILQADIQGDCLRIKFASSGCSGDSWKLKLVGSEREYFSIPPQRDVRLSLENHEMCEAYITKEITFDVRDLRASANVIQLNIINADTSVLYKY